MSLRDQLVAKGLATKKQARRASQEARQARKKAKAQAARKGQREAEEAAAAQAELDAREAARQRARAAAEAHREAHERRHRVRQIVARHRLGGRGPVPFHHRVGDTARVAVMHLPVGIVRDLRAGRAAVVAAPDAHREGAWEHHVVPRPVAERLAEIAPEILVHWVRDTEGLDDPAEGLLDRAWEPSLRPHRVRPGEDLSRWVRPSEAGSS